MGTQCEHLLVWYVSSALTVSGHQHAFHGLPTLGLELKALHFSA